MQMHKQHIQYMVMSVLSGTGRWEAYGCEAYASQAYASEVYSCEANACEANAHAFEHMIGGNINSICENIIDIRVYGKYKRPCYSRT